MKGWAAEQRCAGVAWRKREKKPFWFGRFVDTDAMACAELGGLLLTCTLVWPLQSAL